MTTMPPISAPLHVAVDVWRTPIPQEPHGWTYEYRLAGVRQVRDAAIPAGMFEASTELIPHPPEIGRAAGTIWQDDLLTREVLVHLHARGMVQVAVSREYLPRLLPASEDAWENGDAARWRPGDDA